VDLQKQHSLVDSTHQALVRQHEELSVEVIII